MDYVHNALPYQNGLFLSVCRVHDRFRKREANKELNKDNTKLARSQVVEPHVVPHSTLMALLVDRVYRLRCEDILAVLSRSRVQGRIWGEDKLCQGVETSLCAKLLALGLSRQNLDLVQ